MADFFPMGCGAPHHGAQIEKGASFDLGAPQGLSCRLRGEAITTYGDDQKVKPLVLGPDCCAMAPPSPPHSRAIAADNTDATIEDSISVGIEV